MQRILAKQVIIKRLISAETLGSISVICTDKTGTLTTGQMSADRVVTRNGSYSSLAGFPQESLLWTSAIVCNNAFFEVEGTTRSYVGGSTESALLQGAEKAGIPIEKNTRRTYKDI